MELPDHTQPPGESEESIEQKSVENITADVAPWFLQIAAIVYRNKHLRLMLYTRLVGYALLVIAASFGSTPVLAVTICLFALMIEKDYLDRAAIKFEMAQVDQRMMVVWQLTKTLGGHVAGHEERLDDLSKRVASIPCEISDFTIISQEKKGS